LRFYAPTQTAPRSSTLDKVTSKIVSDESESLILVDDKDNVVGHLDKSACHDGDGVLHRAFSLFIFNPKGELLLQQRAAGKRLWPNYWSNSCCSHPRKDETMEIAVQRRCEQELGFRTPLKFLYKFEYSAQFLDLGSERELCSVFVGQFDGLPMVNTNEIQAWQWIGAKQLDVALEETPHQFTPWFKLEWQRLREDFADQIPLT
jgi:isopentenyl-diphosphate Delta-isomerase